MNFIIILIPDYDFQITHPVKQSLTTAASYLCFLTVGRTFKEQETLPGFVGKGFMEKVACMDSDK